MALLEALGLPPFVPIGPGGPAERSEVWITNQTGFDLTLTEAAFLVDGGYFEGAPPSTIAAGNARTFVGRNHPGADSAGWARYHLVSDKRNVDITFRWQFPGATADVSGAQDFIECRADGEMVSLDGVATAKYRFLMYDGGNLGPTLQSVSIQNASDVDMALLEAAVADPKTMGFRPQPATGIPSKADIDFEVETVGDGAARAAAFVRYRVGPGPHEARMSWRRKDAPNATMSPNDGAYAVDARKNGDDVFSFTVTAGGGHPMPEVARRLDVDVVNDAGVPLERVTMALKGGAHFDPEPASAIDGGGHAAFAVDEGDAPIASLEGLVAYRCELAADPAEEAPASKHVILMSWDAQGKPKADTKPASARLSVAAVGTPGRARFVVTGPALVFSPPAPSGQPTLRLDDHSADGWVEYLQEALNHHLGTHLDVDGVFGDQTLKAVKAFQTKHKKEGVLVDGIVGDQTWSFLREGVPQQPKSDGRTPHTYLEKGDEVRWVREHGVCAYDAGTDVLTMSAVSVGDTDTLQARRVRLRVTDAEGRSKVLDRPLGAPVRASTTGQGSLHEVRVAQLSALIAGAVGPLTIDGYFDADLGGDAVTETVALAPPA